MGLTLNFIGLVTRLSIVATVLLACSVGSSRASHVAAGHPGRGMTQAAPATGPLKVHPSNPRYFSDGTGEVIYLTGSHTWNNFQDWGTSEPPPAFDYPGFLDFLERHGHNFMRLWVWEQAAWAPWTTEKVLIAPLPYPRTGPGTALDGGLKFDVHQWNQAHFERLRQRAREADERGIYVAVMLFNGWSIETKEQGLGNPWRAHPFHRENNVNGIDGDLNGDGEGGEVHTLQNPALTTLQEAYVRKVIDTLGDLDNVLWEISSESHTGSREWQYHMINFIKSTEVTKPKQHPVGMTVEWPRGGNADLFASPADWISPKSNASEPYSDDPPARDHGKVIISDTDHLWGIGGNQGWVWKSFLRGLYPVFMDPYTNAVRGLYPVFMPPSAVEAYQDHPSRSEWEAIRRSMGYTRTYAKRVNLAAMAPRGDLASTGYCLAKPGVEYLVYLPSGLHWGETWLRGLLKGLFKGTVTVDLSAAPGLLNVEWFNPTTGEMIAAGTATGGGRQDFTAPFSGDAVLYLAGSKAAFQR